jgi:putative ABC transport system permease protein
MALSLEFVTLNPTAMLFNFLKAISRYLFRSRFFTVINIFGLSLGLTCSIIIYLYVQGELSKDSFHNDKDITYRVIRQSSINGAPYDIGITSSPFAGTLLEDFSGKIKRVTRATSFNGVIQVGEKSFLEEKLLLADTNFFSFFSFPLIKGSRNSVLDLPNSAVITQELAEKYFGDKDPMGMILRLDQEYDLVVTGVMDSRSRDSHLQFDFVASTGLIEKEEWFGDWWNNMFYTYIQVNDQSDVDFLTSRFAGFMDKYFAKDFARVGNRIHLKLEPLTEIYFNNTTRYETNVIHGNRTYVFIFSCFGILLVLLAAINYMNLSTALASKRAKEVGIRKTLGSPRAIIALQFLSESFILILISTLAALMTVQLILPLFQQQFDIKLPNFYEIPSLWPTLIVCVVLLTFLSGMYPALLLSSFKPVKILKGHVKSDFQFIFFRKGLVVFQFAISIFMIIATLLIGQQLKYLQEKPLGFTQDQVIRVRMNNASIVQQRNSFRERLLSIPAVRHVSFASGFPGGFFDATTARVEGSETPVRMRTLWADEAYANTLELEMVTGRWFSNEFPGDSLSSIILNETAVRDLGWQPADAIGKRVMMAQFDSTYKSVVGVVKDFHFLSLRQRVEPLAIAYNDRGSLLIKVSGLDFNSTLSQIQEQWDGFSTAFPLEWSFLESLMNVHYQSEAVQAKVFSTFSFVSMFISVLGIFGLTTHLAVQRKKEISIRKILGANVPELSFLLIKDLLTLVAVAGFIAMPLAYLAVNRWLENFAYHATPHLAIFLVGGGLVFLFALLTAGLKAMATASENPVENLKTE